MASTALPKAQQAKLDTYLADVSRNDHTQSTNGIYARAYLSFGDGNLSRGTVEDFMEAMAKTSADNPLPRKKAAAKGTQALVFRILKRLFETNGEDWPFRRAEGPKVSNRDQRHVALSWQLTKRVVTAALEGDLTDKEAAFFCLATIYGFRKMEMGDVRSEHLDLERRTLYINPDKRGVERYHLIPEEIIDVLGRYKWNEMIDENHADYIWTLIERKLHFPEVAGMGWHSIRRMLVTLLWEKLPEPVINRFLRWSAGDSSKMAVRYHSVQIVGDGQSEFSVDEAELEADREVFDVHPFLPFWGKRLSWMEEEQAQKASRSSSRR